MKDENNIKDKEIEAEAEVEEEDYEEEEYDYDDDSVDAGGPDVASGKGSKMTLIAFSAVLMAVVFYFLFFKGSEQSSDGDNLDLVTPDSDFSSETPADATDLEDFDSIFGKTVEDTREDVILETPDIPSIPQLPDVFENDASDDILPAFLDLPKEQQQFDSKGRPITPGLSGSSQLDFADGLLPQNLVAGSIDQSGLGVLPGQQVVPGAPGLPNPAGVPGAPGVPSAAGVSPGGVVDPQLNTMTPSSIIVVAGAPGPTNSIGYENNIINLNKDPIADLEVTAPQITSQYISDRTTTLIQGKIITAVLETAINTEFPGEVRGIISRHVYAESGNNILIPRGSRIYGSYSSTVIRGQARVTISWSRLIRPDGVDASVSLNASDQFGRAGIQGDVDNKYGSIITNSILTSVLAVGGAIAAEKLAEDASSTTTTDPTTGTSTTTGSASAQAIADVSETIIDTVGTIATNAINVDPVIRVPQGTKITIVVNSDMSLPEFKN